MRCSRQNLLLLATLTCLVITRPGAANDKKPKGGSGEVLKQTIAALSGIDPKKDWGAKAANDWKNGKENIAVCAANLKAPPGKIVGGAYEYKTKTEPARIKIDIDAHVRIALDNGAITTPVTAADIPKILADPVAGFRLKQSVYEEFVHSCQEWKIHEHLYGQGWGCIHHGGAPANGDPHGAGSTFATETDEAKKQKAKDAYDLAQAALAAEAAFNEAEATYKQICNFLALCGEPTEANKDEWNKKLKSLCDEFEGYCNAFDGSADSDASTTGAKGEFNDGYADFPEDCRDSYTATYTGMKKKDPGQFTASGTVTITFTFTDYKKTLDKMCAKKDAMTMPAEGETKSPLQKKKDALRALCPE